MNILRRIVMAVGGITLVALVITFAVPKTAHGLVATLVQVANTSANPLPIVTVDNPGLHPVVLFEELRFVDGQENADGSVMSDQNGPYTVPAGQRLVVESVSSAIYMPSGQKPFLQIQTAVANKVSLITPVPVLIKPSSYTDDFGFATQFTTYADPGTQVTVILQRYPYSSGTGYCQVSLSGHLENIQ